MFYSDVFNRATGRDAFTAWLDFFRRVGTWVIPGQRSEERLSDCWGEGWEPGYNAENDPWGFHAPGSKTRYLIRHGYVTADELLEDDPFDRFEPVLSAPPPTPQI